MANESNLKPVRTESEARRKGKKGGIASGKARKENKLLKNMLQEALDKETKTGTFAVDITIALIKQAKKGNVRAYEVIRDTLGQKPIEKLKVENTETTKILSSISRQLGGKNA